MCVYKVYPTVALSEREAVVINTSGPFLFAAHPRGGAGVLYIYIYIHTHTLVYIYRYKYVYICVYIYTYLYSYIHMHMHIPMYTDTSGKSARVLTFEDV
jgi:hypothetical protein